MNIKKYLDYTNLKEDATAEDIRKLCKDAVKHKVAAVCIYLAWVSLASSLLRKSNVRVCTVVGFPTGDDSTWSKVNATSNAVHLGADEIDMVMNWKQLKEKQIDSVRHEIQAVRDVCGDRILKVIIEAGALTDIEKKYACVIAEDAGADFVKTSTGFFKDKDGNKKGATVGDVTLMKNVVGPRMRVKAAGGIKDAKFGQLLINVGASRLGTSTLL
jgi:deoxyribose-phosphate aldolase